jgi:hypothetical protein
MPRETGAFLFYFNSIIGIRSSKFKPVLDAKEHPNLRRKQKPYSCQINE